MIETIIFDLAEVCVDGLKGVDLVIANNLSLERSEVKKYLCGDKIISLFEGKISEDNYWQLFLDESKYNLSLDYLKSVTRSNFVEVPGTKNIVVSLKKANMQLGLLSDHTKEWIEYVESKHPFLQLFDERCYSFDSGYTKQRVESFHYAIDKLNANPSKTLFIDDNQNNLLVARSAGIGYIHHFIDSNGLEKELAGLGLLKNPICKK